MVVDTLGYIYAGAVASGGIMGYVKAASIPSLAAGLIFGTALAIGAYQTSQDPSKYGLQLGTTSILGGVMGMRYYKSGKIMPAGLITLLSVANITRLVAGIGMRALSHSGTTKQ